MGARFSSTDSQDSVPNSPISTDSQKPNSSTDPSVTSSSDPKTQTTSESKNPSIETKPTKESDQETKSGDQNQQKDNEEGGGEEEEEEEEGECGFCLFMKGGECKEAFINWEDCVKEADLKEDNVVNKCMEVTSVLRKCMLDHPDYYAPILKAEKAAEEEAMKQLEKEKASESESESDSNLISVESTDSNSTT